MSLVVGVHFFALAAHFRLRFFHLVAAAITACGAAGLLLAFTVAPRAAVAAVSGVLPGMILLGFATWGLNQKSEPRLRSPADQWELC